MEVADDELAEPLLLALAVEVVLAPTAVVEE